MKKIAVTVIFIFSLTIGYSQTLDYKKNEVSIGLISINQSPKNQETLFQHSYYTNLFNSITYKRFINAKNAIRFTYFIPIDKSYDLGSGNLFDYGSYNEHTYKLGYEHIFKERKITPYYVIAAVYTKSTSSKVLGGGFTGLTFETNNDIKGVGLSSTIGAQSKIYKNIFIGLESSLSIIDSKNEKATAQTFPNTNVAPIIDSTKSTKYIFNPLSVFIKIKF